MATNVLCCCSWLVVDAGLGAGADGGAGVDAGAVVMGLVVATGWCVHGIVAWLQCWPLLGRGDVGRPSKMVSAPVRMLVLVRMTVLSPQVSLLL